MIRPSALPMLAACTVFESGAASEFAEHGTDRHSALKGYLSGDMVEFDLLDEEDQAAIRWAGDYIKLHAPTGDYPLVVEEPVDIILPNFTQIHGTPDAHCGPELFDFKWRRRDYTAQMAAYALTILERHDRVRVHLLYGAERKEEVFYLDRDACDRILLPILDACEHPEPTPCDYCGWCAKRLTCPALTGPAKAVALGYGDLAEIPNWHPSDMDKPEHLALALIIWRKVLKKWGESVEFHALEAMTKKGWQLPGCVLATSKGKKVVNNTEAAYEASGLPPEKFLAACAPRLNTSKKYPDRKGLDVVFKEHLELPAITAAKREVAKRLGALIETGKETLKIKLVGEEKDSE